MSLDRAKKQTVTAIDAKPELTTNEINPIHQAMENANTSLTLDQKAMLKALTKALNSILYWTNGYG